MFKIIEGDFKNNIYGNEEYLDNWPMLYLLENGKQIYIGESAVDFALISTEPSGVFDNSVFEQLAIAAMASAERNTFFISENF